MRRFSDGRFLSDILSGIRCLRLALQAAFAQAESLLSSAV
jgi:hypothetical protein